MTKNGETRWHFEALSGMDEELQTPEESAAFLKMHVDSVRRLLRQQVLPGVKVGGGWRIPKSALASMLSGQSPAKRVKKLHRKKKAKGE